MVVVLPIVVSPVDRMADYLVEEKLVPPGVQSFPSFGAGAPTIDDVRGRVVWGEPPLHLAAEARSVVLVRIDAPIHTGKMTVEAIRRYATKPVKLTVTKEE